MLQTQSDKKIRILLVDDHIAIRMGLITALGDTPDMEVVADGEDGGDAIELYRSHKPDVVIIDLRLIKVSGVETIRRLRADFGDVRILIYSNYVKGDEVYQAIKAGAAGFVMKEMPLDRLLEAVRTVHAGDQYIPAQVTMQIGQRNLAHLSPREMEVLRLVAKGLSNKEIAAQLGLVVGTVKIHVANIFTKLSVSDRTQALVSAVKRGLIEID